jgi:UDP-glucose 4-epimerase
MERGVQRVLITGGCGFIGSALVHALQRDGREVFVLDNNSYGSRHAIASVDDAHYLAGDILDAPRVREGLAIARPDAVLHLAAIHFIPHCNQYPFESANINLQGTANVLDAARAVGTVRRLLFASTAAVYPIVDTAISETHPVGPLDIYGLSKVIGERLCHEFHLATGIPTIICRFFNAFGPNETNPHLIPEIQKQVLAGSRRLKLGNLDPKRDFIHTHDMAAAITALLERFQQGYGVFNLGRGEEYSVREIVAAFSRIIGEPIDIEVEAARVRKVERMHLLADVSKLKRFTGWEPRITLDQGIATLVAEGA